MTPPKFLLIALLVTTLALGYVHQRIELLRINYTINLNEDNLLCLLDRNSTLMYNVTSLQSPLYLEQNLISQNQMSWEIPSRWYSIGLAEAAK